MPATHFLCGVLLVLPVVGNWPAYLTTKAAYMGCEQTAGDVCDCEPQWADYKVATRRTATALALQLTALSRPRASPCWCVCVGAGLV